MDEPHLTLEDVARDGFRLQFFLQAFGDEHDALELCFAFLAHVRKYKTLVGRVELLQNIAKELVQMYLREPDAPLRLAYLSTPDVHPLVERVVIAAIEHEYCPLDLFSGLEAHVLQRLTCDKFPQFLASAQYTALCAALRAKRELPLGELLVSPRRTRFLEQHLQQSREPARVWNLRFWIDVQTSFLPLIQTTLFSVALFEEVQAMVRRIYNTYVTATSASAAPLLSDDVRKDTLKQIMTLQGEAFSPPRYAGLFRRAQEKVWDWLQTDVYPAFRRASPLYVLLVVDTENLESDRQLRRVSEQVHAAGTHRRAGEPKSSSIVIPVASCAPSPTSSDTTSLLLDALGAPVATSAFERALVLETLDDAFGLANICFHSVFNATPSLSSSVLKAAAAATSGETEATAAAYTLHYEFVCSSSRSADTATQHLPLCWSRQSVRAVPTVLSPSHRAQQSAPKPSVHEFIAPSADGTDDRFGMCLTQWCVAQPPSASPASPLRTAERAGGSDFAFELRHDDAVLYLPRFVSVTAARPMQRARSRALLQLLAREDPYALTLERMCELLTSSLPAPSPLQRTPLSARYAGFCLSDALVTDDLPLHMLLQDLSTQTITSVLALLLVGRSVVLVSERPSALALAAKALKELLYPFEWPHAFMPLCPIAAANALARDGFFSPKRAAPFLLGLEAALVYQRQSDTPSVEHRHRIRHSIYNVHKVALQLALPELSAGVDVGAAQYAPEILQSSAVVLDIDHDDLYLPGKVDVPEFPHALVRSLEAAIKLVLARPQLLNADTQLFAPQFHAPFVHEMLAADASACVTRDCGVRLAFVRFLDALFGDVAFHFCALDAPDATANADPAAARVLVFEVDSFLDAHIELGCRELFRQCFQTELFRRFLLRQHAYFAPLSVT